MFIRKCCMAVMVAVWICMAVAGTAAAAPPYKTFSYDAEGRRFAVQPAYIPEGYLGFQLVPRQEESNGGGPPGLNGPEDLFIDEKDHLYIADTGNNRIIHLDANGAFVSVVGTEPEGKGKLLEPNGVYVTKEKTIYVADTKNKRIALFDPSGKFVREYLRPQSDYIPDTLQFEPTKVVVDKRGYMYVTLRNGYQGVMLLSPEGKFQGYYGANRVPFNAVDSLKRTFYTKEQLAKEVTKLPGTVSNVAMDAGGFVYTSSVAVAQGQIKKLNYAGKDLLGEKVYGGEELKIGEERLFVDLAVDGKGNISAIDAQTGVIYQYDANGDLLFAFGGKNEGINKLGLFNYPSSIAVNSAGKLYIVDRTANMIQIFHASEFAELIHQATSLTLDGKYDEGSGLWNQVLRLNSKYFKAHLGMAKAYYQKGQWKEALQEFRKAGSVAGYSEAYWQYRMVWLQKHFTEAFIGAAAALLTVYAGYRWFRRKRFERRGQHGDTIAAGAADLEASGDRVLGASLRE
ncbi:6-bladed beta-propeller [Cohnella soli]|uniref:6-bladed beta-propeller n=1 Tax=Cohnella soli TaxID=425005 RepID=A0ABW0HU80_9BACL